MPANTSRSRHVGSAKEPTSFAGKSNLPYLCTPTTFPVSLPPPPRPKCPAVPRRPTCSGPSSPPWSVRAPPAHRPAFLSIAQFLAFHLSHLWSYDRFHCLKWNPSGRQPGAFKRFMSVRPRSLCSLPFSPRCQYTYLATLSCLVCFGVAFTIIKFQEGAFQAGVCLILFSPCSRFHDDCRRRR